MSCGSGWPSRNWRPQFLLPFVDMPRRVSEAPYDRGGRNAGVDNDQQWQTKLGAMKNLPLAIRTCRFPQL
jgi:hypothetical protein